MNKFMLCACGALLAGAAVAQAPAPVAVEGNNTAVVIQKETVVSANGYQFLCVPVKGFDISGNRQLKVTSLDELIPASTLPLNSTVTVLGTGSARTFEVQMEANEKVWKSDSNHDLNTGDIFWVKTKMPKTQSPKRQGARTMTMTNQGTEDTAVPASLVFCGEDSDVLLGGDLTQTGNVIVASGNTSSEKIDVFKEFTDEKYDLPTEGYAYIYAIREGANDYTIYRYESLGNGKMGWTKAPGSGLRREALKEGEAIIAPGEAFYFQNVSLKSQVTE